MNKWETSRLRQNNWPYYHNEWVREEAQSVRVFYWLVLSVLVVDGSSPMRLSLSLTQNTFHGTRIIVNCLSRLIRCVREFWVLVVSQRRSVIEWTSSWKDLRHRHCRIEELLTIPLGVGTPFFCCPLWVSSLKTTKCPILLSICRLVVCVSVNVSIFDTPLIIQWTTGYRYFFLLV